MSKLTPSDLAAFSPWQYWLARIFPLFYITTLTLVLPTILTQSFVVSELGVTQEQRLQKHLRSISIKILARGKTIGSGVILTKQDLVYTAVTNTHIIQSASVPFQIQTHDGQIYAAALITPPTGQNRDLSILRFQSLNQIYITAKLATALPRIGDRVWSAGFPLVDVGEASTSAEASARNKTLREQNDNQADNINTNVWIPTILRGQIVQILPIAISGGYGIGSDRSIIKGMGGGALINHTGELVGINGVHPDPPSDHPEVLEDGSIIDAGLREQIKNANWSIPTQFVKEYARL